MQTLTVESGAPEQFTVAVAVESACVLAVTSTAPKASAVTERLQDCAFPSPALAKSVTSATHSAATSATAR
jgi:hypothetical protein